MYRLWIAVPLCIVAMAMPSANAQQSQKGKVVLTDAKIETQEIVYKKTPQGELQLHVFYPENWKATDQRSVIVFFFGGGWKSGSYSQFIPQSQYLASRGIVAISADYRILNVHKTTPDIAVEDAKSAIRYVRANAAKLGIDPDKVIASGGSAGGHLAAATAMVEGFNAKDDPKVSAKPNALVLFNPALNLTLQEGRTIAGANGTNIAKEISPTLYLAKDTPPAIIFFGTGDRMIDQGREYLGKAKEIGVKTELFTAAEQPHGFFNRSPWCEATASEMDRFLASLGYLKGTPTLNSKSEVKLIKE
jgi:acetyl esterase